MHYIIYLQNLIDLYDYKWSQDHTLTKLVHLQDIELKKCVIEERLAFVDLIKDRKYQKAEWTEKDVAQKVADVIQKTKKPKKNFVSLPLTKNQALARRFFVNPSKTAKLLPPPQELKLPIKSKLYELAKTEEQKHDISLLLRNGWEEGEIVEKLKLLN